MHYIHAIEYYSAVKKNEVLIYPIIQMIFEHIMRSERCQSHLHEMSRTGKHIYIYTYIYEQKGD